MATGIDIDSKKVAGTLIIDNDKPVCGLSKEDGLRVLNIKQALSEYDGLKDYYWKLVDPNKDEYTKAALNDLHSGYFVKTEKGIKLSKPVQTCLYIGTNGFFQNIHNVIIAEEGSELNILTACLTGEKIKTASHVGVTEIYVKKGAKVVFTMIHNWDEDVTVRPRTAIRVEEGGTFISNYICLRPVADIQMYPVCYLDGQNSFGSFNTYIYVHPKSKLDLGGRIVLKGENSRGEILNRVVCNQGEIYNRGQLVGLARGVKAHLDCRGLIMKDGGMIQAIPELEARLADLDMTHEASIGRVSEEQIEYLMARGLSESQAVSMIIKGFLDENNNKLPKVVEAELNKLFADK